MRRKREEDKEFRSGKLAGEPAYEDYTRPETDSLPKHVDKVIMAEAVKRAERAKRYALKFPHFCGKSDEIFQTVEWQYQRELRYQRKPQAT